MDITTRARFLELRDAADALFLSLRDAQRRNAPAAERRELAAAAARAHRAVYSCPWLMGSPERSSWLEGARKLAEEARAA